MQIFNVPFSNGGTISAEIWIKPSATVAPPVTIISFDISGTNVYTLSRETGNAATFTYVDSSNNQVPITMKASSAILTTLDWEYIGVSFGLQGSSPEYLMVCYYAIQTTPPGNEYFCKQDLDIDPSDILSKTVTITFTNMAGIVSEISTEDLTKVQSEWDRVKTLRGTQKGQCVKNQYSPNIPIKVCSCGNQILDSGENCDDGG